MASPSYEAKKAEARKKAVVAAATAAAAATTAALSAPVFVPVALTGAAGVLTYRWIKYRIKEGIRF